MQTKDIAIVFDCGATNIRVIAITTEGQILSSHSDSNETDEDPYFRGGRIWDLDKLWKKLCHAAQKVSSEIGPKRIAGVTVTTFGVDGTFVDEKCHLSYPIISWQCERTSLIMDNISKYISLEELYKITAVYPYAFNTINKIIWFKENKPEFFNKKHTYLFIPSLLINKLSGATVNDASMLGTSMMADIKARKTSEKVAQALGIDQNIFGTIAEPGDKVGAISVRASELTGIPTNVPVFLTGHDTQFAVYGSGAQLNQPVLSSGTWEIIMSRSSSFSSEKRELENNLTTELDAVPGVYNIGQNWLGSGVLEWFSKHFYAELCGDELYETMISEASQLPVGAMGITVDPAFYDDGTGINTGTIRGLNINTSRAQIYRAFLEGLSFRLREGLQALENAGKFKAQRIICVGGGSKNMLWNQIRADVCKLPIQLIDQKETTVLGASMFVFTGAGLFKTVEKARDNISYNPQVIYPSKNSDAYIKLFANYLKAKKGEKA